MLLLSAVWRKKLNEKEGRDFDFFHDFPSKHPLAYFLSSRAPFRKDILMARGRMIDKRISRSKKLGRGSDKARVLYFMIYPHLDRDGRISFDDLDDLRVDIMPYFKNWNLKKIGGALNELADIKLLILYPDGEKIAMEFIRFEDFQDLRYDREAKSKVAEPPKAPESSGVFRINPSLSLSLRKEGRKEEKIYYDFHSSTWKNIKEKDIKLWAEAYPACDIKQELLAMADWLESNPDRKKSNYRAFISRWLKRQQDEGGSIKGRRSGQTRKEMEDKKIEDWTKKKE